MHGDQIQAGSKTTREVHHARTRPCLSSGKRQHERCFDGWLEVVFTITEMLMTIFTVILEYAQTCHRSNGATVNNEFALVEIVTEADRFHGLAVGVDMLSTITPFWCFSLLREKPSGCLRGQSLIQCCSPHKGHVDLHRSTVARSFRPCPSDHHVPFAKV